jgi:hypothetical protein
VLPSELLSYLGRGALHSYYWHKDGKCTQWYETSTIPRPAQWTDVYFGVHPCGEIPPGDAEHVRGRANYVGAVNCFFVDIDFKLSSDKAART